jgi:hypothetical protein
LVADSQAAAQSTENEYRHDAAAIVVKYCVWEMRAGMRRDTRGDTPECVKILENRKKP